MSAQEDVQFLAQLVHNGHLTEGDARPLIAGLQAGVQVDELLVEKLGWKAEEIERLRRTDGGVVPEIPGYEVLGELGRGGTAVVWRVRDLKSSGPLALKVLSPACTRNPRSRKAFISESRLLERLDHPAIVRGFGIARSGATYFCRMELIEGRTLLEVLDEGEPLAEEVALRIVLQVAEALRYMHSEGLVHRDIKPGNVMLTQNGEVKLIDLGFASAEATEDPGDSTAGTVQYLSPEQAKGGAAADLRSDVYSLGVTLFHLVVGHLPFESSDDQELLRMQIMESLSSPELKSRGLSPHLHYFIEKMMAKDAEHRFQSWDQLIEGIEGEIAGRADLDYASGAQRPRSLAARKQAARPAPRRPRRT